MLVLYKNNVEMMLLLSECRWLMLFVMSIICAGLYFQSNIVIVFGPKGRFAITTLG